MKFHRGKFNDQYHLAPTGEDSPLNIDMAGTTRPSPEFYVECTSLRSVTVSFYQLEYVLEGKLYIETESGMYCAEKGDFLFIDKAFFRTLYSDKKNPVKKLFITAKGPLIDGFVESYKLNEPIMIIKADVENKFRNILRILDDAPSYTPVERDRIGVEILSIIQTVARELNTVDIINKHNIPGSILKYIDSNLSRKFTIEELCQTFFLGKTQLIKVFKDKYGVTPMKYAQYQRIELAKYYLQTTDTPISSLHSVIGFDDVKYFSKLFKKTTGMSPSEYKVERNKLDDPVISGKFEDSLRKYKTDNENKKL